MGLHEDCSHCRPSVIASLHDVKDADESSGDAGPHNNTGHAPPALTALAGSDGPTAQHGLGKTRPTDPLFAATACGGRRLAPVTGSLAIRCWKVLPQVRVSPRVHTGRGRKRKAEFCSEGKWRVESPHSAGRHGRRYGEKSWY
jgi:hypothetical protein